MKMIYALLTLLMVTGIYGCNREKETEVKQSEEVTIEREEEYEREDINDQKNLPVEAEEELEINQD